MTADQEEMLVELLENEDANLTGWEIDFLEDLDKMRRNQDLSDKQADKLQAIWVKVFK
tara:strand:- start:5158 stop:5331 length:174 start_codon:yes stop_codon:yes gene_type:complete